MYRIDLHNQGIEYATDKATEVLRDNGVILYPTDTVYGLGACAFSDCAVDKVYSIKGRNISQPMHMIVADLEMAKKYCILNDFAIDMATKYLPGALTLVCTKNGNNEHGIGREMNTIAFRIPDNKFCLLLAQKIGPYTTTSANVSCLKTECDVDAILEQFGDKKELIDLVIVDGNLVSKSPSTIVDVSKTKPVILRQGSLNVE